MNERRTVPKYSPPGARPEPNPGGATPQTKPPKALPAPSAEPDPPGPRAPRYNLTVRLSADERERLRTIGRTVGRPDPLSLAESVRWLIRQWKP